MKIVVIGSGGREHAILWRLTRDQTRHELIAMPGNGGTFKIARNIGADIGNVRQTVDAIKEARPDLVIVGPEAPLAGGIANELTKVHIPCFGPSAQAARVEASKVFAKQLMRSCSIPTADFEIFSDFEVFQSFVTSADYEQGWVVKADGLAAGKGAFVCASLEETLERGHALLSEGLLGSAGKSVVLERKLSGREVSAMYFCDGERYMLLPPAQDYKRVDDGDIGLNTGGMGSFCPAGHLSPSLQKDVSSRIVEPVLRAMTRQGCPYIGTLYVGLILTESGPQVIEFNCRLGDPETQVILPVWEGELAETMLACARGILPASFETCNASKQAAVCVVLAAEDYPNTYTKGIVLRDDIRDMPEHLLLHAGTAMHDNKLISAGGRVLNAIGMGNDLETARYRAYALAEQACVPGLRYRKDIAAII